MAKRTIASIWGKALQRNAATLGRQAVRAGQRALGQAVKQAVKQTVEQVTRQATRQLTQQSAPARRLAGGPGSWLPGLALGPAGPRRYWLYRPAGVAAGERLPLLVMLHGCGQDAERLAASTRMNRVAERERFLVLYPEQERLANAQGCWNWFDTRGGRAQREAASVLAAVDQVCATAPVDRGRVAVAGLSAGASLAALLATLSPERFVAVVMHSGVAPGNADSPLSALGAMRGRRGGSGQAPVLRGAAAPAWPPLLVIQGMQDPVVAPANAGTAVQAWAAAVGARPVAPRTVQRGQRYPMVVSDFKLGRQLVARQVLIDGLAHAWSGGAAGQPFSDPHGPDASRLLWAFVAAQLR
jgi:poly(hydroxyalkanoate) depolymerase family esterase